MRERIPATSLHLKISDAHQRNMSEEEFCFLSKIFFDTLTNCSKLKNDGMSRFNKNGLKSKNTKAKAEWEKKVSFNKNKLIQKNPPKNKQTKGPEKKEIDISGQ